MDWELHHGEALDVLRTLPDASAAAVIMDPPYCSGGVSEASRAAAPGQGLRSSNLQRFGWFVGDNMTTGGLTFLLRAVAAEALRFLHPGGSVLCFMDWRMVPHLIPAVESAGLRYQGLVTWDKGHMGLGKGFRAQSEFVAHYTCGKPEYHDRGVGNVITCPRVNPRRRRHQTEKPVDLIRPMVRVVAPVGGLVVDPFAGSGSVGVACLLEGRRFMGVERDPEHYQTALARLEAEVPQEKVREVPLAGFFG